MVKRTGPLSVVTEPTFFSLEVERSQGVQLSLAPLLSLLLHGHTSDPRCPLLVLGAPSANGEQKIGPPQYPRLTVLLKSQLLRKNFLRDPSSNRVLAALLVPWPGPRQLISPVPSILLLGPPGCCSLRGGAERTRADPRMAGAFGNLRGVSLCALGSLARFTERDGSMKASTAASHRHPREYVRPH